MVGGLSSMLGRGDDFIATDSDSLSLQTFLRS